MLRRGPRTAPATHLSLQRGLHLLEAVAVSGALRLADAVRRTGLHRSTAHHLLQTLVSIGYLRQDPASRAYELTAKPRQLTGRGWTHEQIAAIAQPLLRELSRRTGEGATLALYRDGAVTISAMHEQDGPVRIVQAVGVARPFYCTAVGKAIVAWLTAPEQADLMKRTRLQRHTAKTIVTRPALEAELRRVRAAGYALDDEEHFEGIRCVAVPFFGDAGQVIGSLCALGTKQRMPLSRLRELRFPLAEQARELSARLGWRGA